MRLENWLYKLPLVLRSLFRRRQVEEELDEELQYHIDMRTEEFIKAGILPSEARYAALRGMESIELRKEECRDARGIRWFDEFVQDLSYARRTLARNPAFTIVAIIILALGIGANTAIVSTLRAIVFQPMPFGEIDRLVEISPSNFVNYLDLREDMQAFAGVAAFMGLPLEAQGANSAPLSARAVSANFFELLGMSMTLGRGFLPDEEKLSDSRPVAVISHRLWERDFVSDPAILGRTIAVNKEVLTVVGVAPQKLRDAAFGGPYRDLYVPIPMFARIAGLAGTPMWRDAMENRAMYPFLSLIGRLRADVTLDQARARMAVFALNLHKAYPKATEDWKPTLLPENRARWPGGNALFFSSVLMAAGICIFLITCTNVAGLLLERGWARQREIGTRLALGAGRARIVRQLLAEGFALSASALILSLAVYTLTLRLLPAFESSIGSQLSLDIGIDHSTLILAIFIGLLANVVFGLAPALMLSRTEPAGALKSQCFSRLGQSKARSRRILVVSQIAFTVVLLIAAGLLIRTIRHFESVDPGFDRNVLIVSQGELKFEPNEVGKIAFYRQVLERIRDLPGVSSAGWGEQLPFDQTVNPRSVRPDQTDYEADKWSQIECNAISPGYLNTLSIPILQGRDFADRDRENPTGTVLVNETLARRFWPNTSPLGQRIRVRDPNRWAYGKPGPELFEVIGVVKDAKYMTPWEDKMPYIYFPYWHMLYYHMDLHVSARGSPQSLVDPIRKLFETIDPEVKLFNARLISTQVESMLYQERSAAFVLGIFGSLALVLAAVGLYGIVSYSVAQRTREFGIRIALGAEGENIARKVVLEGMSMALLGLAIGLPCSIGLSRLLESRLHGLSPLNPIVYILISILVTAVAIAAALIPARRAAANPMNALRAE
jgi:predicted permease